MIVRINTPAPPAEGAGPCIGEYVGADNLTVLILRSACKSPRHQPSPTHLPRRCGYSSLKKGGE